MARTVSIRKTYTNDVHALTRLAAAVEKDPKRPEKWKEKTSRLIREVVLQLLDAR